MPLGRRHYHGGGRYPKNRTSLPTNRFQKDAYLRLLQQDVLHAELLVDDVVRWDVRECASNDKYFVFDDTLERILLPLIRDPYCCPYVRQAFRPLSGQDHSGATILEAYPPSGIVPHAGIADLCAPLCFVFTGLSEVYFVFRCFYCRYWLQLQTLASKGENIQTLCKLFERLVQAYNPEVAFHCVSVGLNPLEVVFPWIFTAFSGYLEVEQVLHLWDRILAYDSLWLLSVLAAAVFLWRGRSVLQAETPSDIRALFVDFSKLQVVPLLQYYLFA
ncbi:hypothetical protein DIPPA_25431 [Diplonema papillatum]|nr:hypothetical protein DIPPA_25431 [Diplonema papillatum]